MSARIRAPVRPPFVAGSDRPELLHPPGAALVVYSVHARHTEDNRPSRRWRREKNPVGADCGVGGHPDGCSSLLGAGPRPRHAIEHRGNENQRWFCGCLNGGLTTDYRPPFIARDAGEMPRPVHAPPRLSGGIQDCIRPAPGNRWPLGGRCREHPVAHTLCRRALHRAALNPQHTPSSTSSSKL